MYVTYCKNKPESNQVLVTYGGIWFEELQRKYKVDHPIDAYLIKPVQRITKYQLLLKDLQVCTLNFNFRYIFQNLRIVHFANCNKTNFFPFSL